METGGSEWTKTSADQPIATGEIHGKTGKSHIHHCHWPRPTLTPWKGKSGLAVLGFPPRTGNWDWVQWLDDPGGGHDVRDPSDQESRTDAPALRSL